MIKDRWRAAAPALLSIFLLFIVFPWEKTRAKEFALLLGAGKYACGRWALPLVDENMRLMERALVEEVGTSREDLIKLQDGAVTRTGLLRVLREIGRKAAPGDRLFLYLTGHATKVTAGGAFIRASFTWDTIESADGTGFEAETLITDIDLKNWIRPLRRKGVFVVVIRESCFSGGGYARDIASLSPGRPPLCEPVGDLDLSACKADQAAWAREGASPPRALFTDCLAAALAAPGLRITARNLFEDVKRRVAGLREGQTPVLDHAPGVDPAAVVLVDRTVVDLLVEADDAVTGEALSGALVTVRIPGIDRTWSGRTPGALLEGVVRRDLLFPWIECAGYVPLSRRVEVPPKTRRVRVSAALEPETAEVFGVLAPEGRASLAGVRVAYESGARPLNPRHVDTEVRPRGDGSFRLRVPARAPLRLVVVKGAETLAEKEVNNGRPLDPIRFYDPSRSEWSGRSYDAGEIVVRLPLRPPRFSEAEKAFERSFSRAEDAEERGNLEEALRFYELAGYAADLVSDPSRKKNLSLRARAAVARIEADRASAAYGDCVEQGEAARDRGELAKARALAEKAIGINPRGVTARLLLKDVAGRLAAGREGSRPSPDAAPGRGGPGTRHVEAFAIPGFVSLGEETFACCGVTNSVKCYRHERTGLDFVLVPGGDFYDRWDGRTIEVKPFLICRTECTQEAWDRIGGKDDRKWKGKNLPIERVSWNGVVEWCRKAGLRLPTMAEWEYAGRAGTGTYLSYCFGDSEGDLGFYAWYGGNSGRRTHPVGLKKPNAFGLFDVHGNVNEWCSDVGRPGPPSTRFNRGGCYYNYEGCSFFSYRATLLDGWSWDTGFRPAADLPSTLHEK